MQELITKLEETIQQLQSTKLGIYGILTKDMTAQQAHNTVQAELNLCDAISFAKKSLQNLQYLQRGLAIVK